MTSSVTVSLTPKTPSASLDHSYVMLNGKRYRMTVSKRSTPDQKMKLAEQDWTQLTGKINHSFGKVKTPITAPVDKIAILLQKNEERRYTFTDLRAIDRNNQDLRPFTDCGRIARKVAKAFSQPEIIDRFDPKPELSIGALSEAEEATALPSENQDAFCSESEGEESEELSGTEYNNSSHASKSEESEHATASSLGDEIPEQKQEIKEEPQPIQNQAFSYETRDTDIKDGSCMIYSLFDQVPATRKLSIEEKKAVAVALRETVSNELWRIYLVELVPAFKATEGHFNPYEYPLIFNMIAECRGIDEFKVLVQKYDDSLTRDALMSAVHNIVEQFKERMKKSVYLDNTFLMVLSKLNYIDKHPNKDVNVFLDGLPDHICVISKGHQYPSIFSAHYAEELTFENCLFIERSSEPYEHYTSIVRKCINENMISLIKNKALKT